MREPELRMSRAGMSDTSSLDSYLSWARENKKRADRMLTAAKRLNVVVWDLLTDHGEDYEAVSELYNAALDYEDKSGSDDLENMALSPQAPQEPQ